MKKPPTLPETIREKLDAGRLSREDHIKRWVGYGQNRPCVACERVILHTQVQHELEFADRRVVSMHIGCAGLYEPERRQRGWSSQSTRSDTTAIITAVLFVERPLCLDCIALKARKLGYMLFQLAPWLKRSDDVLAYLATLTRELPRMVVAIEFRHRSWFGERTPSRR